MTCLCCNLLGAKQVDKDIVMYTYAKYHQAEEDMLGSKCKKDQDGVEYNLGKMDALLDMLQFYENLDNYNRGWSDE